MTIRGFFTELQRQSRRNQRERERLARQNHREHESRIRRMEHAKKSQERFHVQKSKAEHAELKRLEKEAREAYLDAREAETEQLNEELIEARTEIDSILASTLERDDFVDLRQLRAVVNHPPFMQGRLLQPIPPPVPVLDPRAPILCLPPPLRGLSVLFGKKKHADSVDSAKRDHDVAMLAWRDQCKAVELHRLEKMQAHRNAEAHRQVKLIHANASYAKECEARESEVASKNQELEELIVNLGYGTADAVQEYVSIVLSNSIYPDHFSVTHEFNFEPSTAELVLCVKIPNPSQVATIKSYKYSKSNDEIAPTTLSQKDCRDRYTSAVFQVALRSFHEVFEADRRGIIQTIALQVGTDASDPSSGRHGFIPFVVAAADRESILALNLANVVPSMTLSLIGAAVSKNPFGLVPVAITGIRRT